MTHTGKESSSPAVEAPPIQSVYQPSSSYEVYRTSTRESCSNSQPSETKHTIEKLEVFRDQGVAPTSSVQKHEKQLLATGVMTSHVSHSAMEVVDNTVVNSAYDLNRHRPPTKNDSMSGASMMRLTQKLQDITTTRASLLRQFNDLQDQEAEVLNLLVQATLAPLAVPIPPPTCRIASPRPLNAPLLPPEQTSRKPRLQSSKTSSKPLHTRTVSAPSISTPRSDAATTCVRIPLSDKTEKSSPVAEDRTLDIDTFPFSATSSHTFQAKLAAQRIPTNFGDDDEDLKSIAKLSYGIFTGRARARSNSSSRGRGKSKSRSKSTTRVPSTPVPKSVGAESYNVPDMVGRKR